MVDMLQSAFHLQLRVRDRVTSFAFERGMPLHVMVREFERSLIRGVLEESNSFSDAASVLGMSRVGLYRKRKRLGLLTQGHS